MVDFKACSYLVLLLGNEPVARQLDIYSKGEPTTNIQ